MTWFHEAVVKVLLLSECHWKEVQKVMRMTGLSLLYLLGRKLGHLQWKKTRIDSRAKEDFGGVMELAAWHPFVFLILTMLLVLVLLLIQLSCRYGPLLHQIAHRRQHLLWKVFVLNASCSRSLTETKSSSRWSLFISCTLHPVVSSNASLKRWPYHRKTVHFPVVFIH